MWIIVDETGSQVIPDNFLVTRHAVWAKARYMQEHPDAQVELKEVTDDGVGVQL